MSRVSFNPKRDLPYIAAAAQAIQFAHAGSVLFGVEGWFFGGIMGVLVSVSVAYATSQYADIAQKRKPYALAGIIILALFAPVIVGTGAYLRLSVPDPYWRGVVAFAWGVIPDVSVAITGFVAGKGLVSSDKPAQEESKPKQVPVKAEPELRKPVTDAALVAELRKSPGATDEQLAQVFRVSRQAIQQRRKKLTPADMGLAK